MRKKLLIMLLIIFTVAVCIVEIKTEFRDKFEPKISVSSDYAGVLI